MGSSESNLEQIADEFARRSRIGQRPSIEEYVARFPQWSDRIRGTLRAVAAMEQLKLDLSPGPRDHQAAAGELPARIGEYEILGEIGRGGMGVVYRAHQPSLDRRVALKVMTKCSLDSVSVARFQREARAAAKLHHSNIIPVFQVDQDEGRIYYAMQLIEGRNLDQIVESLRQSPEPPALRRDGQHRDAVGDAMADARHGTNEFFRSVASIGRQVAEALAYAHSRGIVHRDVKPSNLILDQLGVVWVGDFGLAKEDDEGLTQSGDFVGTIRYMSPERFRGQCDPRADIYALGLSLYELIALKPAYDCADRMRLVNLVANTDVVPLRSIDARTPVDLETIISKAILRDPRDRYASAGDMADDLLRFIEDRPIKARPLSMVERATRWCRRNRSLASALAAVAALMMVFAVGLPIALVREIGLRREATGAARLAEDRRLLLNRHLYVARMNLAGQSANEPGGIYRVNKLTLNWLPEVAGEDLRGWEWYFLRSMCDREMARLELGTMFSACRWSPDGSQVAICGTDGHVRIWTPGDGGAPKVLSPRSTRPLNELGWSADGTRVAAAGDEGTVRVWNVASGELTRVLDHGARVFSIAWSPNDRRLASAGEDRAVRVWDTDSGEVTRTLASHERPVHAIDWHPSGTMIASGSWSGAVHIHEIDGSPDPVKFWDRDRVVYCLRWSPDGARLACGFADGSTRVFAASRREVLWTTKQSGSIEGLAWHPNSLSLAVVGDDRVVRVRSAFSGRQLRRYDGHSGRVTAVDWNRDGSRLASAGLDQTVLVWDANMTAATSLLAEVGSPITSGEWSPDGERIAVAALDVIHLVNARDGKVTRTLRGHQQDIRSVAWSPDGSRLASTSRDATVIVWDVASGEQVLCFRGHSAVVHGVTWSPDGNWLASASHDTSVKVWNARSGEVATNFVEHGTIVHAVDWHPRDNVLVSSDHRGGLILWDPFSGEILRTLSEQDGFARAVCWSPDGTRIASGGKAGVVRLWDVATGRAIAAMGGHAGSVISITWSPDGSRVASCAEQREVRFWDVATATEILRVQGSLDLARSVDWNPDGLRLCVADAAGVVTILDATAGVEHRR